MRYLQLRLAELVARVLPRRMGYGLARRVADIFVLVDRRGRESVMANLRHIHQYGGVQLSDRALRSLARENFLNFAKYLVDFFHLLRMEPKRVNRLVDYGNMCAVVDAVLARGKGVIIFTAHFGNWELGAGALAMRGYPLHAVVLQHPDPKLNALYESQRHARGLRTIPLGRAARECIAALRRNEIIALVADRDFTMSRQTVEFFGAPARLPDGPAKLALATGAPLLPVFMIRRPDDTFTYIVEEPIWPDKARDDVPALMRPIAQAMERVISRHSEQWYLFHNPWDTEQDRALATAVAFGEPAVDTRSQHANE